MGESTINNGKHIFLTMPHAKLLWAEKLHKDFVTVKSDALLAILSLREQESTKAIN